MLKLLVYILLSFAVHAALWLGMPETVVPVQAKQQPVLAHALSVPKIQTALTVQESQAPVLKPVSQPQLKPIVSTPVAKPKRPAEQTKSKAQLNQLAPKKPPVAKTTSTVQKTPNSEKSVTQAVISDTRSPKRNNPVNTSVAVQPPAKPETTKPQVLEVVSQQPRFKTTPKPPLYPASAKRKNQQGQVLIEVRLTAQGVQQGLLIVSSSGVSSLDQAALTAVKGWQFIPETHNGQPVASRVQVPVNFTLNNRR